MRRGDVLVEVCAVEADDAVPAGLLRDVQRVISRADQHVGVTDAWMRPSRYTEARRAPDGTAGKRECMRLHPIPHPFGERHGGVEHGPGE